MTNRTLLQYTFRLKYTFDVGFSRKVKIIYNHVQVDHYQSYSQLSLIRSACLFDMSESAGAVYSCKLVAIYNNYPSRSVYVDIV